MSERVDKNEPSHTGGANERNYRHQNQREYRRNSQSQYKADKDASHLHSCAVASKIDSKIPGRVPRNHRIAVNANENLRMVNKHTNRSDHKKYENHICQVINNPHDEELQQLTAAEAQRLRREAREVQREKPKDYSNPHKAVMRDVCRRVKAPDGKVTWDDRKNTKSLNQHLRTHNQESVHKKPSPMSSATGTGGSHNQSGYQKSTRQHRPNVVKSKSSSSSSIVGKQSLAKQAPRQVTPSPRRISQASLSTSYTPSPSYSSYSSSRSSPSSIVGSSSTSSSSSYISTGRTYQSSGSASGRTIYQGSRGGNFYFTASGNKRYV